MGYTAALACLAHGIYQYNTMLRCAVAHAGNDHRLGAQEAPPAIISLYPGTGFEEHVNNIIKGGELSKFTAEKKMQPTGCKASMPIEANVEDRNRGQLYENILKETAALKGLLDKAPSDMVKEADFLCDQVKPKMEALRKLVDDAEGMLAKDLYPFPTYEQMLYHHHH